MGKKDYLLIVVLYGSLVAGVFFPQVSSKVSGYIKYLMMGMLFLSFVKITPSDVWHALRSHPTGLFIGTVLRLFITPALAWFAALWLYPPLALPVLLLAGASTGVSAPFFTSLCRGNISYCLVMAVATSLMVPVTLPFMVKVFAHTALDYNLLAMALFLAMVILVPLAAAFSFRALAPGLLERVNVLSYPISLGVVAVINFGGLGRYIPYLKANPGQVVYCAVFATLLAMVLAGIGWLGGKAKPWSDRVAISGSQVWVNNVLILALAVQIDQPLAATLAAFYFLPYYGFVVFFTVIANGQEKGSDQIQGI